MNKKIIVLLLIILIAMISIGDAGITKVIRDETGFHQVDSAVNPEYFTAEEISEGINKDVIRAQYLQAIADLDTITNTTNPTNAQIV